MGISWAGSPFVASISPRATIVALTTGVAVAYLFLTQFGGGFGAQSFFQLWSSELFPTLLRASAQGLCFAIVRVSLGLWSFFVPILTATEQVRIESGLSIDV